MKIATGVLAAIEAHARDAAPHECCGLLLGTGEAITDVVRAHNRAANPARRYEIDPQDHFAAVRRGRAYGLDVVGAYHSHPRSAPVPSATDRAEAFEDFVFLIVGWSAETHPSGVRGGGSLDQSMTIRAWRLRSGNFVEVPLVSDA